MSLDSYHFFVAKTFFASLCSEFIYTCSTTKLKECSCEDWELHFNVSKIFLNLPYFHITSGLDSTFFISFLCQSLSPLLILTIAQFLSVFPFFLLLFVKKAIKYIDTIIIELIFVWWRINDDLTKCTRGHIDKWH